MSKNCGCITDRLDNDILNGKVECCAFVLSVKIAISD